MSPAMQRARESWLLAFGDVVTLLLTFFIVVVVMNKADISKIEKWVDEQLNISHQQFVDHLEEQKLELIVVNRVPNGILVTIQADRAFGSGSFSPNEQLLNELSSVAKILPTIKVIDIKAEDESKQVVERAAEDGMQWYAEIIINGHTDNDWVDPESRLRNNFFLSTLRAESVMNVLQQQSALDNKLFSISGYGEYQPLVENGNDAGKQKNRRVEVLITASFQQQSELTFNEQELADSSVGETVTPES